MAGNRAADLPLRSTPQTPSRTVASFGADGVGDDTSALQAAFDWVEANGGLLTFAAGVTYTVFKASGGALIMSGASNFTIEGNGATIRAGNGMPTIAANSLIQFNNCTDFHIQNLNVDGNRANRTLAEINCHNLRFQACHRASLVNVNSFDATCDGWYWRASNEAVRSTHCSEILMLNCRSSGCFRNNMSPINVQIFQVIGGSFVSAGQPTGTNPMAGIDFEPNPSVGAVYSEDILVRGVTLRDNRHNGISMTSLNRFMTYEDCDISHNCYPNGKTTGASSGLGIRINGREMLVRRCWFRDYAGYPWGWGTGTNPPHGTAIIAFDQGAIDTVHGGPCIIENCAFTNINPTASAGGQNATNPIILVRGSGHIIRNCCFSNYGSGVSTPISGTYIGSGNTFNPSGSIGCADPRQGAGPPPPPPPPPPPAPDYMTSAEIQALLSGNSILYKTRTLTMSSGGSVLENSVSVGTWATPTDALDLTVTPDPFVRYGVIQNGPTIELYDLTTDTIAETATLVVTPPPPPPPPPGPADIDVVGIVDGGIATSIAGYTVPVGLNQKLVLCITAEHSSGPLTAAPTANGQALTLAKRVTVGAGPANESQIWYRDSPQSGDIVVNWSSSPSSGGSVVAMTLNNAKAGAAEATAEHAPNTVSPANADITTLTQGSMIVDSATNGGGNQDIGVTQSPAQVARAIGFKGTPGDFNYGVSTRRAGAPGVYRTGWSSPTPGRLGMASVAFAPFAAVAPSLDFGYSRAAAATHVIASGNTATIAELKFTGKASKRYVVFWLGSFNVSTAAAGSLVECVHNGAVVDSLLIDTVDATDIISWGPRFVGVVFSSVPTEQTFQIRGTAVGQTLTIFNGLLLYRELSDNDVMAIDNTEKTNTTTTYADQVKASFTPPTAGDYLIIAKAAYRKTGGSNDLVKMRLFDQSTAFGECDPMRSQVVTSRMPWATMAKAVGLSGAQAWDIEFGVNTTAAQAACSYAGILALRIADNPGTIDYAEDRAAGAASSPDEGTPDVQLSLTPAATVAQDYLALWVAALRGSSITESIGIDLAQDGTRIHSHHFEEPPVANTLELSCGSGDVRLLTTTPPVMALRHWAEAANTVTTLEAAIALIQLGAAQPAPTPIGIAPHKRRFRIGFLGGPFTPGRL